MFRLPNPWKSSLSSCFPLSPLSVPTASFSIALAIVPRFDGVALQRVQGLPIIMHNASFLERKQLHSCTAAVEADSSLSKASFQRSASLLLVFSLSFFLPLFFFYVP